MIVHLQVKLWVAKYNVMIGKAIRFVFVDWVTYTLTTIPEEVSHVSSVYDIKLHN